MVEYVSGYNYKRVPNIPGLSACHATTYVKITQGTEKIWIWPSNAWINYSEQWQGSGYSSVKLY